MIHNKKNIEPIHHALGQTSECDKVGVTRGTHTDGTGMDNGGANS